VRFQINVYDSEIIELLNKLVAITGHEPWARKFAALKEQLKDNPFLRDWQLEHHGVELRFHDLLVEQERTGTFPVQVQDDSHYELYGLAAGIVRIYERLSSAGQTRLRGMLLDGLKPDNTLLALQNEVTTAVHLVSRGFDVEMNDLERGSGVDFIARRDGLEIEVECKMFTGDLGRKLHRRKVLALHKHLAETVVKEYRSTQKGELIRITLPDRLHCTRAQLDGIKATVTYALNGDRSFSASPHCEVQVVEFDVATSPFSVQPAHLTREAIAEFVQAQLGRDNKEMMILFSPGKQAVVTLVESAKPDQVLKGVYRQLREAAMKQFTKTRPGILSVQFQDLSAEDIVAIGRADTTDRNRATGLQLMTSHFLNSPNRGHIHTVAYRSHGKLVVHDEGGGQKSHRAQGISYFIRNPHNPFYDDPRSRAFA
jgi:hypothetical protein